MQEEGQRCFGQDYLQNPPLKLSEVAEEDGVGRDLSIGGDGKSESRDGDNVGVEENVPRPQDENIIILGGDDCA